jgi:DNA helicase-2/ATP-dependent DNA helicase PcrA
MARLGRGGAVPKETNSLPFVPAAHVMPGMAMFDAEGQYDIVVSVERVPLAGTVHDLDVEHTHNYVAEGIVTHNSVYGWRGADIRNILDFQKDFPAARVIRLEENYRSTPQILELANVVISANTARLGKTLRATRPGGEKPTIVRCLDERDEAEWVADEILARRGVHRELGLRDVAVLYRTNAQSRALEEAMRKRALPYRLIGAVRFYDRREIRDLMGYLKLIANPADDEAFLRAVAVPRRGLGEATLDALAESAREARVPLLAAAARPELQGTLRPAARQALAAFAALVERYRGRVAESSVEELLRDLVEEIRYADHLRSEGPEGAERLENVRELITGAAEAVAEEGGEVGLTPLDHFLQRAMLVSELDKLDPDADAVSMMTMHNAKGLEFPLVFLTGLEDGLFPLARAYDDPQQLEEERRLFYVGITRAERKLYLTHAEQRRRNGELLQSKPSGFLADIPEGMLDAQRTIRLRSSGRAFMSSLGGRAGYGGRDGGRDAPRGGWGRARAGGEMGPDDWPTPSAAARRPGRPVSLGAWSAPDESEASQDAPVLAVGARVRHAKFGGGTIAELSGSGRDAKVKVDFDDAAIGRKTLVVAQARLEREWD